MARDREYEAQVRNYTRFIVQNGKTIGGWEYPEDARDELRAMKEEGRLGDAKIVARSGLAKYGIDPKRPFAAVSAAKHESGGNPRLSGGRGVGPGPRGRRVSMSEQDIERFNQSWPASNLRGLRGVAFTFEASGDLVDVEYKNGNSDRWDGPEILALSHDAQKYADRRVAADRPSVSHATKAKIGALLGRKRK
jgi:hypothetical protein